MANLLQLRRGAVSGLPSASAGEPLFTNDQFRLYVNATSNRLLAVFKKIDGTTAPSVNDDAGDGFSVGSIWTDTTNDKSYICSDSTVGSAVWQQFSGGGTGVSDGDKGDVTVSSSGTIWTIDNDAVTYAKIQNVSTGSRLLGRSSGAGAGDIEELTLAQALGFFGNAVGNIIHYGNSGWQALALGSNNQIFVADTSVGAKWQTQLSSSANLPGGNWIGATSGEVVLGSSFVITAAASTFEATGLQIVIGSAGTYKIVGQLRGEIVPSSGTVAFITGKLRNITDSTDVANSETLIVLSSQNGVNVNLSACMSVEVTIASGKTLELYVKRNTTSTSGCQLVTDSNGRTKINYHRIY